MKILSKSTGREYPSEYEWGKSSYWEYITILMLSKRNLSIEKFGSIKNVLIGDSSYPLNLIEFENGLEIYDEINSPSWAIEENDKLLNKYMR